MFVPLPDEIPAFYARGLESRRLLGGAGRLELARTQDLLRRYLPHPPAVVLDVGGGSGVYATWLAREGFQVHLVDPVPLHVAQARQASDAQPDHPIASATVGDGRALRHDEASVDAVLLLGPLYHLTERADRVAALREGGRVVREGGVLVAAVISRFASLLDGLASGYLDDPTFARIVERDLREGQHRNPDGHPAYFTTAYFHRPDEIASEMEEAGLRHEATVGVEGPGWLLRDFDAWWADERRRARLVQAAALVEAEPALLGVSAHLLAVARRAAA